MAGGVSFSLESAIACCFVPVFVVPGFTPNLRTPPLYSFRLVLIPNRFLGAMRVH